MNLYPELPLDQLGAQAKAHIMSGDKAKEKVEQHYKSAGLYLIAARERVKNQGLHWVAWLRENVRVAPSRAYEIIAIADGTKSLEEVREVERDKKREQRAKAKAENSGTSRKREYRRKIKEMKEKMSQDVPSNGPTTGTAQEGQGIIEEVRKDTDQLARIIARLNKMDQQQLEWVEQAIVTKFGK